VCSSDLSRIEILAPLKFAGYLILMKGLG